MENKEKQSSDIEVGADLSRDKLSLRAKGAGIFILLLLSIGGIIYMGYLLATTGNIVIMVPLLFLLYITYALINTVNALFRTDAYIEFPYDGD